MKGKVLEFNSASRTGTISADDGNRYAFSVDQWKSAVLPKAGSRVDFSANASNAEAIFLDGPTASGNSKKSRRPCWRFSWVHLARTSFTWATTPKASSCCWCSCSASSCWACLR